MDLASFDQVVKGMSVSRSRLKGPISSSQRLVQDSERGQTHRLMPLPTFTGLLRQGNEGSSCESLIFRGGPDTMSFVDNRLGIGFFGQSPKEHSFLEMPSLRICLLLHGANRNGGLHIQDEDCYAVHPEKSYHKFAAR